MTPQARRGLLVLAVLAGAACVLWLGWPDALDLVRDRPAIVLTAILAVAVGELALVRLPSGRTLAPISSSTAMALVSLGAVDDVLPFAATPAGVVTVIGTGHALSLVAPNRRARVDGVVARFASASVLALLARGRTAEGGTAWEWQVSPSTPRWQVALALVALACIGLAVERFLAAVLRSGRLHSSVSTALGDELQEALPFTTALLSPAPIATLIAPVTGLLALPLALLPVLVNLVAIRRYMAVRQTFRQTIRTLSRVTEIGGYTPTDHARRTATVARGVAQRLDLGEREITELEYAALLHDLGQVTLSVPIPDGATVLAAPADQRSIARAGADIVRNGPEFARLAELVDRQAVPYRAVLEHEEEAPLAARILRVANAFDDLTHGSTNPGVVAAAIERIHLGLGYEYDPVVVDALEDSVGDRLPA